VFVLGVRWPWLMPAIQPFLDLERHINHFLAASNRPGIAGARIAGDGNVDAEADRDEKADASANRRGRSRG